MLTYGKFLDDVYKYKLEMIETLQNHEKLSIYFSYANGCGAKSGIRFPSTMWGVNIEAACNLHDMEWALSTSYVDLLESNERFDNNLKRITDRESNSFTAWLRRMRVAKYVTGVELVGTRNYAIERGFLDA